jgi:hypothetical protein
MQSLTCFGSAVTARIGNPPNSLLQPKAGVGCEVKVTRARACRG